MIPYGDGASILIGIFQKVSDTNVFFEFQSDKFSCLYFTDYGKRVTVNYAVTLFYAYFARIGSLISSFASLRIKIIVPLVLGSLWV